MLRKWTSSPDPVRNVLTNRREDDVEFYVCDCKPFEAWSDLDCTYDGSAYAVREVRPFYPVFNGIKITDVSKVFTQNYGSATGAT
jgi:hypothetical protein